MNETMKEILTKLHDLAHENRRSAEEWQGSEMARVYRSRADAYEDAAAIVFGYAQKLQEGA